MKFGGLQAFTMSDFPGRLAAIVFTQGCNFRCPFCHNGTLLDPAGTAADPPGESDVLEFLLNRQGKLDGLVITGGEPTLHQDLPDFLRQVKGMGFLVKLDTNGSNPGMLGRLLGQNLVDYIAMDLKAPWEKYTRLAGLPVEPQELEQSVALIAGSGVDHQFRTTYVTPLLSEEDLAAIKTMVPAGSPHKVQTFRPELARDPALRLGMASLPDTGHPAGAASA